MPTQRNTVFVHIGLHKTGTTYLQNVLAANRDRLADQGVRFPGGQGDLGQTFAAWDLLGRRPRGARDERVVGQWEALRRAVAADPAPVMLLSAEALSIATARQAQTVVEAFPGADVHVVVTVRDLARVLVSAWQEEVKNGRTWALGEFTAAVGDPRRRAQNPARGFWLRQDAPTILRTWRTAVPLDHVHVVTVPPPGAPPQELLRRVGKVVGFDEGLLDREGRWGNESIGVAGTEVLRRLNAELGRSLNQRQYDKVVKHVLVRELAARTTGAPPTLPEADRSWVSAEGRRIADELASEAYDVVGNLDELLPDAAAAGEPSPAVTQRELFDTAVVALAGVTERYARAWWSRRRTAASIPDASSPARAASAARGLLYRSRRSAAHLADRNPLAGQAMRGYLRLRDARSRPVRRDAGSR